MSDQQTRDALRQILRSSPQLRHAEPIRAIAAAEGIDLDEIDLRGARSSTRPARPERDRLHVERGGSNAEEAARWTANVDEFIDVAAADAKYLSPRKMPADPILHAAYREWLYAVEARFAGLIVTSSVKHVRAERAGGDRYYVLVPTEHPAAHPDVQGGQHDRADAAMRKLVCKELAELLPDAETTPRAVKQRRRRWHEDHRPI